MNSGPTPPGGPGGADRRRVLVGRYRLDEVIGRGGMSTVYRGTDLALDRTVAVKVAMDPLLERDPVYTARFKREARAAAALNSAGVVTVFDAGADGPTRYIVMEYVEGRDLSEILREDGPLDPPRAARIGEQIAATLAAAHAAGIVHRDIKPGNVMITEPDLRGRVGPVGSNSPDADREQVKVLDFGIARTPDGVTLTQTASVLGTAPYMSPEQATGQPADARSDIYSLGCVLYEMLTGKPPFMGDLPAAVLHQHVRVAAKPPSALKPSVPPALDALVLAMLAKAPKDRPQTAREVRDRLAAYETATEPTQPIAAAPLAMPAADALAAAAAAAAAAADVPQVATVPQAATPTAPTDADRLAPTAADRLAPTAAGRQAQTAPGRTRRPPGRAGRPPGQGAGPWAVLAVIALLLLGAAVAYAVSGAGAGASSSSSSSNRAPAAGASSHRSSSSAPPASHSTSSSTSTVATTTTTITTTTTPTTPTTTAPGPPSPGQGGPPPPGQGGAPPGQAKKKK